MTKDQSFNLFESLIQEAEKVLMDFTLNVHVSTENKADKSVVTECDKKIDLRLSQISQEHELQVVSEEGEHVFDIVKSGNYITIDPIDGTLGYIDYVNYALEHGGINNFLKQDLGSTSDFCLLLGIVENGIPQYGACFNFITGEKILIDGNSRENLIRENNVRGYNQKYAVYVDQRPGDYIEKELVSLPDVTIIKQAALGLKSLYTILNPHESAITCHRVQVAGLWDILPSAVAARAFSGQVYDDKGAQLKINEYILLPGKGATILKGNKFSFVLGKLRK